MKLKIVVILALMLYVYGCSGGGLGDESNLAGNVDYSGKYRIVLGASEPRFSLQLIQSGKSVSFLLLGPDGPIAGNGAVIGDLVELNAVLTAEDNFYMHLIFGLNATHFSGSWEMTGSNPIQGTLTGSMDAWETYQYDSLNPPQFVTANSIDLDAIQKISKFRSGIGHDFSDQFESCRSMKYYFYPKDSVDISTIEIYSPIDGEITGTTEEWEGDLWKGTAVGIQPTDYPAFHIIVFHINPVMNLNVGMTVTAGELLGTSQKQSGTASDFALGVNTADGFRLLPYFRVISDSLFLQYQARGMTSVDQAVISRAERDTDPLMCSGQEFVDSGMLENWFVLN